jgi:hypothetical protein
MSRFQTLVVVGPIFPGKLATHDGGLEDEEWKYELML